MWKNHNCGFNEVSSSKTNNCGGFGRQFKGKREEMFAGLGQLAAACIERVYKGFPESL